MATLWIDNNMEIRWHPNGWPVMPGNPDVIWIDQGSIDQFNKALAQAKAESILVELSDGARHELLTSQPKSDTFIDFEGEVEVVDQIRLRASNEPWKYVPQPFTEPKELYQTRQVARLVPQTKDVNDNPLPDANDKDVASIEKGSALYFPERQIADLKAQLAAAEKRCEELEEFYWIAEYALRDIDAFYWVIDPIKRARVALEKLSKLPIPVKYEEQTK